MINKFDSSRDRTDLFDPNTGIDYYRDEFGAVINVIIDHAKVQIELNHNADLTKVLIGGKPVELNVINPGIAEKIPTIIQTATTLGNHPHT